MQHTSPSSQHPLQNRRSPHALDFSCPTPHPPQVNHISFTPITSDVKFTTHIPYNRTPVTTLTPSNPSFISISLTFLLVLIHLNHYIPFITVIPLMHLNSLIHHIPLTHSLQDPHCPHFTCHPHTPHSPYRLQSAHTTHRPQHPRV